MARLFHEMNLGIPSRTSVVFRKTSSANSSGWELGAEMRVNTVVSLLGASCESDKKDLDRSIINLVQLTMLNCSGGRRGAGMK